MSDWDHHVDVVVLGSGAAGLTAAVTAAAAGATVEICEKAPTLGGTTATSGGLVWIPAHKRIADSPLPVSEAMEYLRAQSHGFIDEALVEIFVRTGPAMLDFVEDHSALRMTVATGFPDYRPELPGGRPGGGRAFAPAPADRKPLGQWANRITAFPADFSDVGTDAETRARIFADADEADVCVAGTALVGGLLQGVLDAGVRVRVASRAVALLGDHNRITGVEVEHDGRRIRIGAHRGVVLATGGFEWDRRLVEAFLRGPMRGATSPPYNTGDGLRMAMAHGADLANMSEAWWVPVVQIPGDTFEGQQRSRSTRLERTRPRSIIVNGAGKRFLNEAGEYNAMAGPFHYLDSRRGYVNDPAWIVFDALHLKRYGAFGVQPGGSAPDWFAESADLAELASKTGIEADGLSATLAGWNRACASGEDPDFGRGATAYDVYWGDQQASSHTGKTLGPIDTAPYYAVPVAVGAMGTKGGVRTDGDGRVCHVSGSIIAGLFAAGNAMAGVTGKAYGGPGGTLGPAMVFGYRAGFAAATTHSAPIDGASPL